MSNEPPEGETPKPREPAADQDIVNATKEIVIAVTSAVPSIITNRMELEEAIKAVKSALRT
jgi:hypothetical protein